MKGLFSQKGSNAVYIVVFSLILLFFVWGSYAYQWSLEENLLSEAKLVANQVKSIRNYFDRNQDEINKDASGAIEFKNIHADVAVRDIAEDMRGRADVLVRLVSATPRNENNSADNFELKALELFKNEKGRTEYYKNGSIGGHKVFRYLMPLQMVKQCEGCHGKPAGQMDITRHEKEGYEIGDIIGAISVAVPASRKFQLMRRNISVLLIFVFLLMFSIGYVIHSIKKEFEAKLEEAKNIERVAPEVALSASYSEKMSDLLHKMVMHNLRNPVGDILTSAEMLKDVPIGVLQESVATSSKINGYASKMIFLKKLEQGRVNLLLDEFDFGPVINAKLRSYEKIALKNAVKFEGKLTTDMPKVTSDKTMLFKAIDYVFLSMLKFTSRQTGKMTMEIKMFSTRKVMEVTISNNAKRIGGDYESVVFEDFVDIKDRNGNFMFSTEIEFLIAKILLRRLNCELVLDSDNKEKNVFKITIPLTSKTRLKK